ncbi:MAG TPA: epoxide hydrolase N-terminal domain-containing protein, partial [Candidatus Saccharimonadales bacterium]
MTIKPFTIDVDQIAIDNLKQRLADTRFPQSFEVEDWSRGVPKSYLKKIVKYWEETYDWKKHEAAINLYPQFITEID